MKCYFCMDKEAEVERKGPLYQGSELTFHLCSLCAHEKDAADKRSDDLLELQSNDVSKLCVGCGICCFILNARVTKEEADKISGDNNVKFEDFAVLTDIGQVLYPDDYTIKVPCTFLLGKPLGKWTACRIHNKIRPAVCGSYLCKMAIRYQLGTISLGEARYWLRLAIQVKDLSIFNWIKDSQEAKILISSAVATRISQLRKENVPDEQIRMMVASLVTPNYTIRSPLDDLTLCMHFATHDRGDNDPKVFFSSEELEDQKLSSLSPIALVEMTIERVVSTFRKYYQKSERSFIEQSAEVNEEKMEKLKEELGSTTNNKERE